jgi:lipoprotein NlpD
MRPERILRTISMGLVLFLAALVCAGCATSYDKRGVYYKVRGGDSIWRIARIYRTDVQRLAEYNNILDGKELEPGTRLYIPPRQKKASFKKLPFGESVGGGEAVAAAEPGERKRKGKIEDQYSKPIQVYRGRFVWPIDGKVVSAFGYRDGRRHDGIDVSAPDGTPVHAAAAGKVVFAGSMRGYGNLILLRHQNDLFTAYAHNSANKVQAGQMVKQGQLIASVGHTGRSTGPHLHFELRHGQTARNPLFFLPDRGGIAYAKAQIRDDADEDGELDPLNPKGDPDEGSPSVGQGDDPSIKGVGTSAESATAKKSVSAPAKRQAGIDKKKAGAALSATAKAQKPRGTKDAALAQGKAKTAGTSKATGTAKATSTTKAEKRSDGKKKVASTPSKKPRTNPPKR